MCTSIMHYLRNEFHPVCIVGYNDNGSVQTLSALCTQCLHIPIVIINQRYTKGEIHYIYLHIHLLFIIYYYCFDVF